MVVLFFVSNSSSLLRWLFFCIMCLHFQHCLCFSFDRVRLRAIRLPINNSNSNSNNHMNPTIRIRYLTGKQRKPRGASTGSSDEVLESEALSSVRICYQSAAASAFVDGITFNWSSLRQGRNWETLVPVVGLSGRLEYQQISTGCSPSTRSI
jgi:hypothetical protein